MTGTDRRHAVVDALFIGVAQAMAWAGMGLALVFSVSRFEEIFVDFDAELPGMTILLLSFTRLLAHFWYLAALLLCLWPPLNLGIVLLLSPRAEVVVPRRIWYWLTWLAPVVFAGCAVAAIVVPLMRLIWSLSA